MSGRRPTLRRRDLSVPGQPDPTWYRVIHALMTLFMRVYIIRFYVQGAHLPPPSGPVMLVSNHQSKIDPFLVGWPLSRPIAMPGKAILFRLPIVGLTLRRLGGYPLEEDPGDVSALRTSMRVLRDEHVLAVFPEGGRSRTGEILPFLPTLTKIAIRERSPITPAAIAGSRDFLAPGKVIPRPLTPIVILYGPPFELSSYYGRRLSEEDLEKATEEVRTSVLNLFNQAEAIRRNRAIFEGRLG